MEPRTPPSASPLVSGLFLLASFVGGWGFLAGILFWVLGWQDARAQAAFVFGLCALPVGPFMLAKLWHVRGFARSFGGLASLVCLLCLWGAASVPALFGGPPAALQAHPFVVLLGCATVCVAFLFSPPRKDAP